MNDADIELIIALVAGDLTPEDEVAARARIEGSVELRDAYAEQLAVATMLQAAPVVAMTAAERDVLHAALRSELRLDDTPPALAPSPSRNRWWIGLTGLATAAVAVFAFAIVPDLVDDGGGVLSPTAETQSEGFDTFSDGEALVESTTAPAGDAAADTSTTAAPTTVAEQSPTTAATEESEATDTTEPATDEPVYYLSPVVARTTVFNVPILDDAVVAASGLDAAIAGATEFFALQIADLIACFTGEAGTGERAFEPAGVGADTNEVYGTATDLETGEQETLVIALDTCEITRAE